MKVSFLTIGTEITTGEIANTNVQWLSERVESLGLDIVHHLSVPDHKEVMRSALDYISTSDILILTGGLGPTQDDLTRFVVADWLGEPLVFNDQACRALEEIMQRKGRTPLEAHKTQCHFPMNARLIWNSVGSAQGFWYEREKQKIFVLPGPPRELKPMWENEVEKLLPKGSLTPWVKWVIKGVPESEVAMRFERLLSEHVDPKTVEIGYRASMPFVHVKVRKIHIPERFDEKMRAEFQESLRGEGSGFYG